MKKLMSAVLAIGLCFTVASPAQDTGDKGKQTSKKGKKKSPPKKSKKSSGGSTTPPPK